MVEFAIGALLFFAVVGVLMTVAHLLFIKYALNAGANEALYLAAINHDYHISTDKIWSTNPGYVRFQSARDDIINQGKRVPLAAHIKPSTSTGGAVLQKYTIYHTAVGAGSSTVNSDVLILRPGESATYVENGTTKIVQHPEVCSWFHLNCTSGRVFAGEEMVDLMKTNVVLAQLRARVWTLFGTWTVTGEAVGYPEVVNRSLTGEIPPAAPSTTTTTAKSTTSTSTSSTVPGTTTSTTSTTTCTLSSSICYYNYSKQCFTPCRCKTCSVGS